jgi:hypothetical protein
MVEKNEGVPPWIPIFTEIALRALLRLHYNYLYYSTNQQPSKQQNVEVLNSGPGVAYADELTVCAAIFQEFLASRYVTKFWINSDASMSIKEGERTYSIDLEPKYPNCNDAQKADLRVQRITPQKADLTPRRTKSRNEYAPSYIEAKRAFLWKTNLGDTSTNVGIHNQSARIKADIEKLKGQLKQSKITGKFYAHLLVWNVQIQDKPKTDIGANNYFAKLHVPDIKVWQVRTCPLPADDRCSKKVAEIKVKSALWVALVEVENNLKAKTLI